MCFSEQQLVHLLAVARAVKLEVILIGNAAAALQGAPVLTQDVHFFVRRTLRNLQKLQSFAARLESFGARCDKKRRSGEQFVEGHALSWPPKSFGAGRRAKGRAERNGLRTRRSASVQNGAHRAPLQQAPVGTADVLVDFVFRLSSGKRFESVRSRASRIGVGKQEVLVASLADIIAAKEAAGRLKDRATLPILKDTLRVKRELEKGE